MVLVFAETLDRCSYWPDMKTFRYLKKKKKCFVLSGAQADCSL